VDRKVVEVAGHLYVEAPKNRKTIYPRRTPAGYPLAECLSAISTSPIRQRVFAAARGCGCDVGGTSIYVRANIQEVACAWSSSPASRALRGYGSSGRT